MKSNKQWLDELAATNPQALQAWFDAPRDAGEASIMSVNAFIAEHDAPRADCKQVDGNDEKISFDVPLYGWKDSVSVDIDSREQLERDIDTWLDRWIAWSIPKDKLWLEIIGWLDRQAAITRAECDKPNWEYCETCDLTRKVDNLAHDLRESERLREEMREELSIAYDHAHDLLARRDRGLA